MDKLWKSKIKDVPNIDLDGEPLQYRGDNYLHSAGQELSLTKEQLLEYKKCKEDICYFLNTYGVFNHPEKGISVVELYEWQERYLHHVDNNKYAAVLCPRQSGKSQSLAFYIVWYLLFHNDRTSGIVANKESVAKEIFQRVVTTFRYIPHFLKPGVSSLMKTSLELDNGSRLVTGATSESGLSGYTINGLLLIDEVAKIPRNLFDAFYASMEPTVARAAQSKLVMISTPLGMNHWYDIWTKAEKGESSYKPFSIKWNEIPGRDEAWREQKIKSVGKETFAQEYEAKFTSSSNSLFDSDTMENIQVEQPIRTTKGGSLRIYEEPVEEGKYICGVDCSEGTGQDSSVVQVVRIDGERFKQVAVYSDNEIEPTLFPKVIASIGNKYNEAVVIVENNGIGHMISHVLQNEVGYENMFHEKTDISTLGVRMTKKVRNGGVARLRELIENRSLKISDFDTFQEMTTFVYQGGTHKATSGCHDDMVMGLVIISWFTTQDWFKEFLDDYDFMDKVLEKKNKELLEYDEESFLIADENGVMSGSDGFNPNEWNTL